MIKQREVAHTYELYPRERGWCNEVSEDVISTLMFLGEVEHVSTLYHPLDTFMVHRFKFVEPKV